jgi:hypothetical protein
MQMQLVSINKLKNNNGQIEGLPKNPRLLKDDKFKKLVKSIQDDPEMLELREVIAYDNNGELIVIAGNMRLKACQEVGIKEIPTKILPKETSVEKLKAYTIKDNVAFGEHDWEELANSWDVEQLTEWGLDIPNFDSTVLEAEEDDFAVPDGGSETDIVLGDLFEIGEHRLLCGDSTDIEKVELLINGQKCNLLTDPPYGINANKQTLGAGKKDFYRGENWDNEVPDFFYVLTLVDKAIIWGGNYFSNKLDATNDWLCWHKKNDGRSFSEFELAWSNLGKNCRLLSHHWGGEEKVHPTMKPIKVMQWCIEFLDEKPILDIFSGSGSTMVASHQLKRKCYGMELDPKYCQVIIDRMKKLDSTLIIKKNGVIL